MVRYTFLIAVTICAMMQMRAQAPKVALDALNSVNSMQGTEFFIAVPPNELNPYPTNGLEVYVCSQFDTEITVTDFGGGKTFKKEIAAYVICTLSDNREETNWTGRSESQNRTSRMCTDYFRKANLCVCS